MDGIKYNVYFADYYQAVEASATTEQLVRACISTSPSISARMASATPLARSHSGRGLGLERVSCPVFAVACQAEGFDSAAEAMNAAFGANYDPWGGDATNWQ